MGKFKNAITELNAGRLSEVIKVDEWVPDYKHKCSCCGNKYGNVTGVANGKTVYCGDMCGACTWGESAMIDPDKWNK